MTRIDNIHRQGEEDSNELDGSLVQSGKSRLGSKFSDENIDVRVHSLLNLDSSHQRECSQLNAYHI